MTSYSIISSFRVKGEGSSKSQDGLPTMAIGGDHMVGVDHHGGLVQVRLTALCGAHDMATDRREAKTALQSLFAQGAHNRFGAERSSEQAYGQPTASKRGRFPHALRRLLPWHAAGNCFTTMRCSCAARSKSSKRGKQLKGAPSRLKLAKNQ